MIKIVIPGDPIPWKRARSRGKVHFTDPRHAAQADRVRAAGRNAGYRKPSASRFRVVCRFYRQGLEPDDPRFGDADNLVKLLKDALEGIVWTNDRKVIDERGVKIRDDVSPPRTEIEIENLDINEQVVNDYQSVLGSKALGEIGKETRYATGAGPGTTGKAGQQLGSVLHGAESTSQGC